MARDPRVIWLAVRLEERCSACVSRTHPGAAAMSIEAALFGMLGKDAETKTSAAGKPYLRLNIRTGDGDAAQWVNAMTFDPDAIAVADKMRKGARIYIEGRLSLDEWTGQD